MTDRELVLACAEKVMGWMTWRFGPDADRTWNPLTSDSDAFMLVDALNVDKYGTFKLKRIDDEQWTAVFGTTMGGSSEGTDRRRAIVLAAMRAVGVEAV